MTADLALSLTLIGPELIVALGAIFLLMLGVFSGERATAMVNGLAVAILIGALAWLVFFGEGGKAFNVIADHGAFDACADPTKFPAGMFHIVSGS